MTGYIALLAAGVGVALAAASLLMSPRRPLQVSFAAGMLALSLESALIYALLLPSAPTAQAQWLIALQSAALLTPIPWCLFAFLSGRHADAPVRLPWRVAFTLGGTALVAVAGANLLWPFLALPETSRPFLFAKLTSAGQGGVAIEILGTVAVLYGLEPSLRNSWGSTRWRLKYLALGLVGIFVVRFYLLSQLLLFHALAQDALLIRSVVLLFGEAFISVGLMRSGALRADLSVSRHFVYRSIAVGVSGTYLLLAGTAGWLMNALGIPQAAVFGTLILFVAVMGLSTLALSESLRWRAKRYLSTHFYANKYDYRQQWRTFTARLTARVTLEGLGTQLLRSVTETIGTTKAALYLADDSDGRLRLRTTLNADRLPRSLDIGPDHFAAGQATLEARPIARLGNGSAQALLEAGLVVAVPLRAQNRLLGVLLAGAERTGAPYTQEDFDVLTTLGEQAASAVATVQLSERLAESRAFEAFNRLSSFVIHDLKNSISALSLLTQNARDHLHEPEFRQDALKTLARSVERMQKLVGRLASRQPADQLGFESVPLDELARDTAASMPLPARVKLVLAVEAVPSAQLDTDAIQRVIQNLITNGVEAMDGEGTITVRVGEEGGMVVCAVSDTGCGMSDEFIRTSLFVPFQTTKKGGWGIGLYQAREIMAAHGGRIEVSSEEGHGTTITLLFPEERK